MLTNRYGDCKGSANLIKALLKSSGLDGRLVWIGTKGEINYTWDEYPMMGSGNHMIAACVLPDTIVFIDGTTDYASARYISPSIRGQRALVENGPDYMLCTVPSMPLEIDTDSLTAKFNLNDNYALSGDVTHTLSGIFAMRYDTYYNTLKADKRDKFLLHLARQGKNNIEVSDVRFSRESPSSQYAVFSAKILDDKAMKKAGNKILVTVPIFDADYLEIFDDKKRYNPVHLPYLQRYVATVTVNLGNHASNLEIPKDAKIDSPWFSGLVSYSLDGDELKINADLSLIDNDIPLDRLSEWNDAVRQAKRALSTVLKFRVE